MLDRASHLMLDMITVWLLDHVLFAGSTRSGSRDWHWLECRSWNSGFRRSREPVTYSVTMQTPNGLPRTAPDTFARKTDADRYLTMVEAQMVRGEWIDPERTKILVGNYAERWIAQRPNLRPRTVALYRWLLGKHVSRTSAGSNSVGSTRR
jgi:hypothetical protein